jgi:hypothetical protein
VPVIANHRRNSVQRKNFALLTAIAFAFSSPAFAQRGHGGGPPAGHGASGMASSRGGESNGNSIGHANATDMSHGSPADVLMHNKRIADKIQHLTNEPATTACGQFKHLGQCVAAAHLAKNLDFPGGFEALKAKITGSGAISLGKAISGVVPPANAKSEIKKANKQASDDMKETETGS